MEIKFHDVFATRVWMVELTPLSAQFDGWRKKIDQLRSSDMQPRGKSNRMGWNSQPTIFSLPEFKELRLQCINAFNVALKTVSPVRDYKYSLEAWANINDLGGFNTLHNHPGALMSGVFYLTVPQGAGNLIFRDPRMGVLLSPFHGHSAPNATNNVTLVPKEGMLAIFPNWLEHRVEPHEGEVPRVSVAMNAQQAIVA